MCQEFCIYRTSFHTFVFIIFWWIPQSSQCGITRCLQLMLLPLTPAIKFYSMNLMPRSSSQDTLIRWKLENLYSNMHLKQMVRVCTRGGRILDVFLTNYPFLWNEGRVNKGLAQSDHLVVTVLLLQNLLWNMWASEIHETIIKYGHEYEVQIMVLHQKTQFWRSWRMC